MFIKIDYKLEVLEKDYNCCDLLLCLILIDEHRRTD